MNNKRLYKYFRLKLTTKTYIIRRKRVHLKYLFEHSRKFDLLNNLEPSFFVWRKTLQKMYLIVKGYCMQSLFQRMKVTNHHLVLLNISYFFKANGHDLSYKPCFLGHLKITCVQFFFCVLVCFEHFVFSLLISISSMKLVGCSIPNPHLQYTFV